MLGFVLGTMIGAFEVSKHWPEWQATAAVEFDPTLAFVWLISSSVVWGMIASVIVWGSTAKAGKRESAFYPVGERQAR